MSPNTDNNKHYGVVCKCKNISFLLEKLLPLYFPLGFSVRRNLYISYKEIIILVIIQVECRSVEVSKYAGQKGDTLKLKRWELETYQPRIRTEDP